MTLTEFAKKAYNVATLIFLAVIVAVIYLVYLPLGFIRVFIDIDSFKGFLDCIGDFITSVGAWFKGGVR